MAAAMPFRVLEHVLDLVKLPLQWLYAFETSVSATTLATIEALFLGDDDRAHRSSGATNDRLTPPPG
jgi:hypothetical protein